MKRLYYYIIRTCVDAIIVFACLFGINYITTNSVISNEMALEQMKNSNEAFLQMEMFTSYKNGFAWCLGIVAIIFCTDAAIDIYKIIKNIEEE